MTEESEKLFDELYRKPFAKQSKAVAKGQRIMILISLILGIPFFCQVIRNDAAKPNAPELLRHRNPTAYAEWVDYNSIQGHYREITNEDLVTPIELISFVCALPFIFWLAIPFVFTFWIINFIGWLPAVIRFIIYDLIWLGVICTIAAVFTYIFGGHRKFIKDYEKSRLEK